MEESRRVSCIGRPGRQLDKVATTQSRPLAASFLLSSFGHCFISPEARPVAADLRGQ